MATLVSAELKLWIYEGQPLTYTGTPNYTVNKTIIPGESVILFETSELVKDYIDVYFDGNYDTARLSAWTSWEITNTFDDATTSINRGTRLVTLGYGYFSDEINPQLDSPLQQSNTCIYWKEGEPVRIPVYKDDGLYSISYYDGQTYQTPDTYDGVAYPLRVDSTVYKTDSSLLTTDMTKIDLPKESEDATPPAVTANEVTITTEDGRSFTVYINFIEECKNTPYKVTFINKFGALQDIWFFGRRKESANISRDQYKINTVQSAPNSSFYATSSPTDRLFNINSKKSLVLNTGFICDDYNEVIQQMMQSEYVWIHEEGKVYPVNPKDSEITYKDHRYEKLLNFTVNFEYAYNELNSVR